MTTGINPRNQSKDSLSYAWRKVKQAQALFDFDLEPKRRELKTVRTLTLTYSEVDIMMISLWIVSNVVSGLW